MKALKDHNRDQKDQEANGLLGDRAGVACDTCGTEMVYNGSKDRVVRPTLRGVECPNCGAFGDKAVGPATGYR